MNNMLLLSRVVCVTTVLGNLCQYVTCMLILLSYCLEDDPGRTSTGIDSEPSFTWQVRFTGTCEGVYVT